MSSREEESKFAFLCCCKTKSSKSSTSEIIEPIPLKPFIIPKPKLPNENKSIKKQINELPPFEIVVKDDQILPKMLDETFISMETLNKILRETVNQLQYEITNIRKDDLNMLQSELEKLYSKIEEFKRSTKTSITVDNQSNKLIKQFLFNSTR